MLELQLIIIVLFLSWSNVYLVQCLDYCMDYGNILGWIRVKRAKRLDKELVEAVEKKMIGASREVKVREFDTLYWNLINTNNSLFLKSIVCIDCMTIRINLLIQISVVGMFLEQGVAVCIALVLLIASIGLNWFFNGRK